LEHSFNSLIQVFGATPIVLNDNFLKPFIFNVYGNKRSDVPRKMRVTMLSVILMSIILVSVILLRVITITVIRFRVILLSVILALVI
jgi:hypothetical protein